MTFFLFSMLKIHLKIWGHGGLLKKYNDVASCQKVSEVFHRQIENILNKYIELKKFDRLIDSKGMSTH